MSAPAQTIGAPAILALLAEKHAGDVFVPECKSGPTQTGRHDRIDAWVMPRSWAHPEVTGYEIKVSRGDFLRDQKWTRYLDLCNLLYFVAPKDVIQVGELPDTVGLLEVTSGGRRLITRRKAVPREVQIPEEVWRYVLMCRSRIVGEIDGRPDSAEFWRLWLVKREADLELGREVGGRIRKLYDENVTKQKGENDRLRSRIAALEKTEQILAELGIDHLSSWGMDKRVRDALEEKRRGLSCRLLNRLKSTEEAIRALRDVAIEEIAP